MRLIRGLGKVLWFELLWKVLVLVVVSPLFQDVYQTYVASVGVSFNKIFAKLGSDYKKPDATTLITVDNFRQIVWPLPVTDLLFVGRAAGRVLAQHGVATIGQLAAFDRDALVALLGKGHEGYIESHGVRRPFSEWAVLEDCLAPRQRAG